MPNEFGSPSTLGELLSFANGKSSPERDEKASYPVYGSNGVIGHAAEYNSNAGTIVIGRVGSYCGSLQFSKTRCWVTDNAIKATAKGSNDSRFMYYLLGTLGLNNMRAGSGQPLLNQSILNGVAVIVPAPKEQRAIAQILGSLDDKIELNPQINETLGRIALALFKSWFVDFDPVCAKAKGREHGLPVRVANLFPDLLEDSEVGEIPRGWEVRSLDEIARFLNGLALQRFPPKDDRSLPVIKIAQLRSGTTDGADSASADLDSDYIVEDGDVLFSWSGSLECVLWAGGRGALNQHLFKVTSNHYPKWLYYLWVHQHLAEFRRIAAAKATTMGHIQRHHLSEAKVVLPGPELLEAAGQMIGPLVESIPARSVQSRSLAAVRDLLLPKLLSGKIRVKDIDGSAGV
jgi:type I restriction enzyme S subunit